MSTYINIGNAAFADYRNDEYVDKSGLIAVINDTLNKERRYSCVTRSRRFGKSMAARMLCAYYDKSCSSRDLFADLEIAQHPSFEKHLNKYVVIKLDVTDFTSRYRDDDTIVDKIQSEIQKEILDAYPQIASLTDQDDLMGTLIKVAEYTQERFIMIIDEWDSIFREFQPGSKVMDSYISWMRRMFKGSDSTKVFAGVYITGILPIKKYNTESALNNFWEYSMISPRNAAGYFGFTRQEVQNLCAKFGMDFEDMVKWYDGYQIGNEPSIFNPSSVIQALYNGECESFWAKTGSFEKVASYISMNYDGLKEDVIKMLSGGRCPVEVAGFGNDIHEINSRDDVFTVLIHLGYLSYDKFEKQCYIPNMEVRQELENAVKSTQWHVAKALDNSRNLLAATLNCDEQTVARSIEFVHEEETSILSYNDENSLSCALSIAYYAARDKYIMHRELATGKGFADIVLIPRKGVSLPAMILELKTITSTNSSKGTMTAIDQIKQKNYIGKVQEYTGDILLVGINYDKAAKTHTCSIEKVHK